MTSGLPRFPSLSGPFGLSLPPSSCRPKGPAPPGMVMSEGESRKASTEGDTRPRSRGSRLRHSTPGPFIFRLRSPSRSAASRLLPAARNETEGIGRERDGVERGRAASISWPLLSPVPSAFSRLTHDRHSLHTPLRGADRREVTRVAVRRSVTGP